MLAQLVGDMRAQVANGPAHLLHLAGDVGVEAGAARIADLLLALRDVEHRLRHGAAAR